jgi:transposase-like protein
VRKVEADAGEHGGLTTCERDRIKALEREVRGLRQANEILRKASAYFAQMECDWQAFLRPFKRSRHSSTNTARLTGSSRSARCCRLPRQPITSMWHVLPILRGKRPGSARYSLRDQIQQVWDENFQVYGVRKVWRQLLRVGLIVVLAQWNA